MSGARHSMEYLNKKNALKLIQIRDYQGKYLKEMAQQNSIKQNNSSEKFNYITKYNSVILHYIINSQNMINVRDTIYYSRIESALYKK